LLLPVSLFLSKYLLSQLLLFEDKLVPIGLVFEVLKAEEGEGQNSREIEPSGGVLRGGLRWIVGSAWTVLRAI
jgi:hypothetical protein